MDELHMFAHALTNDARHIEFAIDNRNIGSKETKRKLGTVQEGVMRKNRVTWTGHVRDTALFSILNNEWTA